MKNLIKSKAFITGFFIVIWLLITANIYSALPGKRGVICMDCYVTFGFPFALYESGTILHLDQFIWAGVIANISVAVSLSFVTGLIFKFVWSKISSRRVELK